MKGAFSLTLVCFFLLSVAGVNIYVDVGSAFGTAGCGTTEATACPTIASAFDVSQSGDTVVLLPGLYGGTDNEGLTNVNSNGQLIYNSFGLTITGQGNPNQIIVNCIKRTRFLTSYSGFITTIQNLTVAHCQLGPSSVTADSVGGALFFTNQTISLYNLIFEKNSAEMGGALAFKSCNATIDQTNFIQNNATIFGGGVASESSSMNITHSVFSKNKASGKSAFMSVTVDVVGRGGAYFASGGAEVVLDHCTFSQNNALISGGAVQLQYVSASTVTHSTFSLNTVFGSEDCLSDASCNIRGGALLFNDVSFTVSNSIFINNSVSTSTLNQVIFVIVFSNLIKI